MRIYLPATSMVGRSIHGTRGSYDLAGRLGPPRGDRTIGPYTPYLPKREGVGLRLYPGGRHLIPLRECLQEVAKLGGGRRPSVANIFQQAMKRSLVAGAS